MGNLESVINKDEVCQWADDTDYVPYLNKKEASLSTLAIIKVRVVS